MINGCVLGIVLFVVAVITLIVFLISHFIQPILPSNVNSMVLLCSASLLVVLAALAALNDIIELAFKLLDDRPYSNLKRVVHVIEPRPRLTIAVKDINCISEKHFVEGPKYKGQAWAWVVECLVEISNQGRLWGLWATKATDVSGRMRLAVGRRDSVLEFKTAPGTARNFSLSKGESVLVRVRFPRKVIPPQRFEVYSRLQNEVITREQFEHYPGSPYLLEYTYSCSNKTGMKTRSKGKLSKADWTDPQVFGQIMGARPFLKG